MGKPLALGGRLLNDENLIPISQRPKEEQREIQRAGGRASVKARRQKKLLRDSLEMILSMPIKNKKDLENVRKLGLKVSEVDNGTLVMMALFQAAKAGDIKAIHELRDIVSADGLFPGGQEGVRIVDDIDGDTAE